MYVTNVTVLRRNRGFTPYDILEAVHRVLHGQAVRDLVVVRDAGELKRNIYLTLY